MFLLLPLAFQIESLIWNRTQNLKVFHLAVDNFNVLLTDEALSEDAGAAQDFSAHGQHWARTPPSEYVANVGHLPRDTRFPTLEPMANQPKCSSTSTTLRSSRSSQTLRRLCLATDAWCGVTGRCCRTVMRPPKPHHWTSRDANILAQCNRCELA
jgi:hypothetical protein